MLREKRQSDPYRTQADALRQAASDGFAALQLAHLKYEHALEVAGEEYALSAEAIEALRHQGHEYAEAVTRYSNAAMAWLAFMETIKQDPTNLVLKSTTSG